VKIAFVVFIIILFVMNGASNTRFFIGLNHDETHTLRKSCT